MQNQFVLIWKSDVFIYQAAQVSSETEFDRRCGNLFQP